MMTWRRTVAAFFWGGDLRFGPSQTPGGEVVSRACGLSGLHRRDRRREDYDCAGEDNCAQ